MERTTNLEIFTENIKRDGFNVVTCAICRGMENNCEECDHCPTLFEFAEFLNGKDVSMKNILLTKLEYDVLDCLDINHKCALMEDVPVIRDFISKDHFKYAKGKGLTIQYILDHANVVG